MAFASHLCPRFPPHFFWKQQIYANPFFWFFTFSVILADLHADTEKKRLLLPVVSRMSAIYQEFWAKIMYTQSRGSQMLLSFWSAPRITNQLRWIRVTQALGTRMSFSNVLVWTVENASK